MLSQVMFRLNTLCYEMTSNFLRVFISLNPRIDIPNLLSNSFQRLCLFTLDIEIIWC